MKKVLLSFADRLLSKEQMKAVKGGDMEYCCECLYGPGTWYGTYSSASAVGNAMHSYCTVYGPSGTVNAR